MAPARNKMLNVHDFTKNPCASLLLGAKAQSIGAGSMHLLGAPEPNFAKSEPSVPMTKPKTVDEGIELLLKAAEYIENNSTNCLADSYTNSCYCELVYPDGSVQRTPCAIHGAAQSPEASATEAAYHAPGASTSYIAYQAPGTSATEVAYQGPEAWGTEVSYQAPVVSATEAAYQAPGTPATEAAYQGSEAWGTEVVYQAPGVSATKIAYQALEASGSETFYQPPEASVTETVYQGPEASATEAAYHSYCSVPKVYTAPISSSPLPECEPTTVLLTPMLKNEIFAMLKALKAELLWCRQQFGSLEDEEGFSSNVGTRSLRPRISVVTCQTYTIFQQSKTCFHGVSNCVHCIMAAYPNVVGDEEQKMLAKQLLAEIVQPENIAKRHKIVCNFLEILPHLYKRKYVMCIPYFRAGEPLPNLMVFVVTGQEECCNLMEHFGVDVERTVLGLELYKTVHDFSFNFLKKTINLADQRIEG